MTKPDPKADPMDLIHGRGTRNNSGSSPMVLRRSRVVPHSKTICRALLDQSHGVSSNPCKPFWVNLQESSRMRVAFLGLGIMGRPMAANLVKAGHEATVWNRTPGKEVEGARSASSPAEAANGAEVVWMSVSDTKAVESVLFGSQGVEQSLTQGMTIVDSSTISPSATRKFAERVHPRGVQYVDAPVTGSKVGAESGTLIFILGGD